MRKSSSKSSRTEQSQRSERQGKPEKRKSPFEELTQIKPDAAGIDIGSTEHYVSVPSDRDSTPIRKFGCMTPELIEMAEWLQTCGVRSVAMESTGVYWIPVYQVLEDHGFEVVLVDAHAVKNAPGRKKTDVHDCFWLRKVYSYGMLNACFVPNKAVGEMRAYWRQRAMLVQEIAKQIHLMQKSLEQMNIQIHKVLSDISGFTGMAIIRAILAGERDPVVLARLKHPGVKSTEEMIVKALTGNWRPEHIFALKQAVATYDFTHQQMQECNRQLEVCMEHFQKRTLPPAEPKSDSSEPKSDSSEQPIDSAEPVMIVASRSSIRKKSRNEPQFDLRGYLLNITGVDLVKIDGISVITAQTVVSECGPDLRAFPTEGQFASWLGLCPNNRITGGKVKSSSTRKVPNRAAQALRLAAQSLFRCDSALGAYFRRMRTRLGTPAAITATAHKLARLIYRMIKHGEDYVDRGQQWYEEQYQKTVQTKLLKQANSLGFHLVCAATGEVVS